MKKYFLAIILICVPFILIGCGKTTPIVQTLSGSALSSSAKSFNAKDVQTITLSHKKMQELIRGLPRELLSANIPGVKLQKIGVFTGKQFSFSGSSLPTDSLGTLATLTINWNGSGNRITVERVNSGTIVFHQVTTGAEETHLHVDRILSKFKVDSKKAIKVQWVK